MTDTEWAVLINRLLGTPFRWNARGPDAYDCWGLVMEVRRAAGLVVPDEWGAWSTNTPDSNSEACGLMEAQIGRVPATWKRDSSPLEGAIVAMSTHQKIHHVGVATPFGVLDTTRQLGVTLNTVPRLRDLGYKRVEFYQWVG